MREGSFPSAADDLKRKGRAQSQRKRALRTVGAKKRAHLEESSSVRRVELEFGGDLSEEEDLNGGSGGVPKGTTDSEFVGDGGRLEAEGEWGEGKWEERERSARRSFIPASLTLSTLQLPVQPISYLHRASKAVYSQSSSPRPCRDDSLSTC